MTDTPTVVAALMPWLWLLWTATSGAVVIRVWRRDIAPHRARMNAGWIVGGIGATLVAASYLLPSRIDSSGLMELMTRGDAWKGIVGEAVLRIVEIVSPIGPSGAIAVTRLFVVPACLFTPALVVSIVAQRGEDCGWEAWGIDIRVLLASLALLMTPSFTSAVVGVYNYWFFGIVVSSLLLALLELRCSACWSARLAASSSLVLVGLARPETIVSAVVASLIIVLSAYRRRDFRLGVPVGVAVLVMMGVAPSMVGYLIHHARGDPLLMGHDTAGDASLVSVGWILLRRVVEHMPVNVVALLLAMHVLVVAAVIHAVRMARRRRHSVAELVAVGCVVGEFLAIGVHREGFVRSVKYGYVVVVPIWFLCMVAILTPPMGARQRRWLKAAAGGALVVCAAHCALSVMGVGRCASPEGKSRAGQLADVTLLWKTVPRWADGLCAAGDASRHAVVALLDQPAGAAISTPDPSQDQGRCETERWPVFRWLRYRGCRPAALIPHGTPVEEVLCGESRGVDRAPLAFDRDDDTEQVATDVVVTFYRPTRAREIRAAIEKPGCRWEVVDATESGMLLRRPDDP